MIGLCQKGGNFAFNKERICAKIYTNDTITVMKRTVGKNGDIMERTVISWGG